MAMLNLLSPQSALTVREYTRTIRRMDYGPKDIYLAIESDLEFNVRLHSCKKEPETIEWIESFVKEGDVFYDIGANVGAYSLVASKVTKGQAKVYAFEPGFPTFAQLCRNIMINQCEESLIALPIALSDRTELNGFNYSALEGLRSGGALHSVGESIDQDGKPFTPAWRQTILCYRLDDLIETMRLPFPNHMKVDVDGHELAILRGAEKTLSNSCLRSLLIEINEQLSSAEEIMNLLSRKGFIFSSKRKTTGTTTNVIFIREAISQPTKNPIICSA